MKTLNTTIPLSPSQISEYCSYNSDGNPMKVVFDIGNSKMINHHMLNYLSHLKIPCEVENFSAEFLRDYITTTNFLGETNLAKHHANVLYYQKYGTPYFPEVLADFGLDDLEAFGSLKYNVIESLPMFLLVSCGRLSSEKYVKGGEMQTAGVNFAHLVPFPEFLLALIGDTIFNFEHQHYYSHYYDEFIYGGDKLIQWFVDNPQNLLMDVGKLYHG